MVQQVHRKGGKMTDDLIRELEKRGTAEISNGVINQVMQALDEKKEGVKFSMFGEIKEQKIIPIEHACAKCTRHYFKSVKECQVRQSKDAKARGFNTMICPQQFID